MSTKLFELKKQYAEKVDRADQITMAAIQNKSMITGEQSIELKNLRIGIADLEGQIRGIESNNTITKNFPGFAKTGMLLTDSAVNPVTGEKIRPRVFSHEYAAQQLAYIQSNGRSVGADLLEHADPFGGYPLVRIGATLYEGSNTGGGYAVPVIVDDQIVPWHQMKWPCAVWHRSFPRCPTSKCRSNNRSERRRPRRKPPLSPSPN